MRRRRTATAAEIVATILVILVVICTIAGLVIYATGAANRWGWKILYNDSLPNYYEMEHATPAETTPSETTPEETEPETTTEDPEVVRQREIAENSIEVFRIDLVAERLNNFSLYRETSNDLLPYSFFEYDAYCLEHCGFSDAASIPLDYDRVSEETIGQDIIRQVGEHAIGDPVYSDMIAQALTKLKLASSGQTIGGDINGFIKDKVDLNTERLAEAEYAEEGYRGWENFIGVEVVTENGVKKSTRNIVLPEQVEFTAYMMTLFENVTYVGTTTESPTYHWRLDREKIDDYVRRDEIANYEEHELWHLFTFVNKGGQREFLIGFNEKDLRIGIWEFNFEPETNPPTVPQETTPEPGTGEPGTTPYVPPYIPPETTPYIPEETTTPEPETTTPEPETTTPEPQTEPQKRPEEIVSPERDPQCGGQADVNNPEPPERFQPNEPTQPATTAPPQTQPATQETVAVGPTEACGENETFVRDDIGTIPETKSAAEGERVVQPNEPEADVGINEADWSEDDIVFDFD